MDIFEYIDKVKANFDKKPEPRYNMKKYFMGGSVTTPKRGLVDGPGSYSQDDKLGKYIYEKTVDGKKVYELEIRKQKKGERKIVYRKRLPANLDNLKELQTIRDTQFADLIASKLSNEKFLELREINKNLNNEEFAKYLNTKTKFKPVGGEKWNRKSIDKFSQRAGFKSDVYRVPEDVKKNIYKDYLKQVETGETNLTELARKNFPDTSVPLKTRQKRIFSVLKNFGVDRSEFKTEFDLESKYRSKAKTKYVRKERIQNALNKAGPKTKKQYLKLEAKILDLNKNILKMSDQEILNNKFLMKALNIDASVENLNKGIITFDKYKNLSDKEQVAKIRQLADNGVFFQPEHIKEVATAQQNIVYPNNLQVAPGKVGSYMNNIKTYVKNNPNGNAIPAIKNFLNEFSLAVKEGGQNLGFQDIIYNSKTGTSNIVERGANIFKDNSQLKNLISKIGCPDFAAGGRVGFQTGTNCMAKGVKAINSGKIAKGAQARNFAKFANRAYKLGRGIMKYGVIPEALFVGAEALIRMNMGDTLDEALYRASDIFIRGNQTDYADVLKIERTLGGASAEVFKNVTKWKRKNEELQRLEQAEQADLAVAGDEFAETSSGVSADEITKTYAKAKDKKRKEVLDASVSADDRVLSQSYFDEAYDISKAKSTGVKMRNNVLEDESQLNVDLLTPEADQEKLNTRMSPLNFRQDMEFDINDILNIVNDNLQQGYYKSGEEAKEHALQILAEQKKFKAKPLSSYVLDDGYTREQVYGTQEGRGFLEKINRDKFIRPGTYKASSEELDDIYDMGRLGASSGGVASGPPPEKGPQSQGLAYLMKNGKR